MPEDNGSGASGTTTEGQQGTQGSQQTPAAGASTGSGDLGDAGKRALNIERDAREAAEKEAKAAKAELEKLRAASMSEQEKAVAAARTEGKTEALKTANARLLAAEVKAAAAGKLADPSDAVSMLDLSKFEIDDDGNVDLKAVSAAIAKLIEKKPYLAANRPGSFDGGARGGQSGSDDMNARIRQAAGRSA